MIHPTSTKCCWSLLKTVLNDKKYHLFHVYLTITSMLLILKKNVKSSTIINLISNKSVFTVKIDFTNRKVIS